MATLMVDMVVMHNNQVRHKLQILQIMEMLVVMDLVRQMLITEEVAAVVVLALLALKIIR